MTRLRDGTGSPADICAWRHRGNPESAAANARVHRSKYELRTMIYEWIRQQGSGGATCEELTRGLGVRYTTASARISELKADRWLAACLDDRGQVRRRKTQTGSTAAVLRAVSAAERDGKVFLAQQTELFASL